MVTLNKTKSMCELCEITSSKRIYVADYQTDGIPFYRGKEIIEKQRGNLAVSTKIFISEDKFNEIKAKFGAPEPGDVLLSSVGTLGVPYVVKNNDRFYFKDGNLTWFRKFNDLDSHYLYYWLLSPKGKAELKKCTIGASQPAFTIVLLKDMKIELPPILTQRKIVKILSAYDDLIENNTRRIQILEEMAHLIYQEWFVNFRFPGHEKVKFVDSELGKIPEGWDIKPLEIIADLYRGRSYRSDDLNGNDALPFFNLKNIQRNGGFRYEGTKRYSGKFKAEQKARIGDILIAVTDMTQERNVVARAVRVPKLKIEYGVFSMDLVRIEPKENISKLWLYGTLRYSQFSDKIKEYANGANVLHLSPDRIKEYQVLIPPYNLQNQFDIEARNIFSLIDSFYEKNENLRLARDLLLPKLISGELDVSDLDIAVKGQKE